MRRWTRCLTPDHARPASFTTRTWAVLGAHGTRRKGVTPSPANPCDEPRRASFRPDAPVEVVVEDAAGTQIVGAKVVIDLVASTTDDHAPGCIPSISTRINAPERAICAVTRLVNLCFDANEPVRLARFWASALGWEIYDDTSDEIGVIPTDGTRFILVFSPVPEPKTAKNPIHLDLVSESVEHQREIVNRFIELGAQHVDIGQGADADHVVLADPEGNEFCIVLRGSSSPTPASSARSCSSPRIQPPVTSGGRPSGGRSSMTRMAMLPSVLRTDRGPFITFGPPGSQRVERIVSTSTSRRTRMMIKGPRSIG